MNNATRVFVIALFATVAACGGHDKKQDDHKVMKPEDTVFRDLVTAPGKVEAQTNEAMAEHRKLLEERLREDEGGSPPDPNKQQDAGNR